MKFKEILKIIEVVVIALSFGLALFSTLSTLSNNNTISKLSASNNELLSEQASAQQNITQLLDNLTVLQESLNQLTENQTNLQQTIFALQNYPPTIIIKEIQPIIIGPTPPITTIGNGRVTFGYNGTLNFQFLALVSSPHAGDLAVDGNSFGLSPNNSTLVDVGFVFTTLTSSGYDYSLTPNIPEELNVTVPFAIDYSFSTSLVLQYSTYNIGSISCQLSFLDYETNTTTYSRPLRTTLTWNNQTS